MDKEIVWRLGWFAGLAALWAVLLVRINLFGVAAPLLFVYFVATFRRNYPRWAAMAWSFALGLCADAASNTPGMAAASMTFAAFVQPYILSLFVQREEDGDIAPSLSTLGWGKYPTYLFILVAAHHTAFYAVEAFSLADPLYALECVGGSTALTMAMALAIEMLRRK